VGGKHFHLLPGCLCQPLRAQNVEIGDLDILDDIQGFGRLFDERRILGNFEGLVVGQDPAASKKRLTGLDAPVVVVNGSGNHATCGDSGKWKPRKVKVGLFIEAGVTVGRAEFRQKTGQGLLPLRLRALDPLFGDVQHIAVLQRNGNALLQGQRLGGYRRGGKQQKNGHDNYPQPLALRRHYFCSIFKLMQHLVYFRQKNKH